MVLGNLNLYSWVSANVCPRPVVDVNSYNVKERFQKLVDAIGNKELEVRFKHNRKSGDNDEYDYKITLCGKKNGDKAATQKETSSTTSKIQTHVIAKHTNRSLLIGGEDWLWLQYFDGEKYQSHCSGKRKQTWLSIRCEEDGEKPDLKVIEEARYENKEKRHKDTLCYFLFEYNHPAACSHLKKKKKLSGGAIFCIILLVLASVYLIVGFLYQRYVVGAKGWEQIPNFSFWRKVGNASADGCDFVCRREEHPTTYKGMADALDIDTSDDEDKDDGLLPM